jgi:tetratricopeptide (TPR) repeat protein
VRTIGAVAVYLVVFAATGYPLIQAANETARNLQKPAPGAGDANRQASDSLSIFIRRASDYARVDKYDLAIKEYDKAIEMLPFNDRGGLYEELGGGYDQAID